MVAVPPEIGTTRVSLFEASSVPETGRSWVIDTHWFGNSGSKARKVPVTALALNWSAPVNSAIGVGRVMEGVEGVAGAIAIQLPERLGDGDVVVDGVVTPQPRRAANGINNVKRSPGNMAESYACCNRALQNYSQPPHPFDKNCIR